MPPDRVVAGTEDNMTDRSGTQGNAEQARIEFLDRELDLCKTFLEVAENEAHDPEREAQAMNNARKGYETVSAWIGLIRSGEELERLSLKLSRLRERLYQSSR